MLYLQVVRLTARRMSTYRGATVAGVVTNTVFGFILAYVMLAVFRERPDIGGFDAIDAVTFVFVTQGMLMVVGVFGSTEQADRVLTGDVAVDLSRPYDLQGWWAAVAYGKAAFYAVFRGVPPFLVGALVFDFRLPEATTTWGWFLLTVALGVGVAFAFGFLIQLAAFWLIDIRGLSQLGWLTAQFLSGVFVPVVLFPDWLETLARALPFVAMVQLPVEVFLEQHRGGERIAVLAHQVTWLAILVGAGRIVMARAVRKVVVQGG
ncbi:MAG TPA: ABC-2 family transporter protein [Acidimicrobiales bacterium]|nr:ABC-2 family transporter protein [Acidimicrobiales bacterium]